MRLLVIAVLLFGVVGVRAQAPIVRRPPPPDGPQAPQSNESQVPTIKVQTRLVNVALNVVDAHGSPVGGLVRDDFEIFEDGTSQRDCDLRGEDSSTPLSIDMHWRSMRARVCLGTTGWSGMRRKALRECSAAGAG